MKRRRLLAGILTVALLAGSGSPVGMAAAELPEEVRMEMAVMNEAEVSAEDRTENSVMNDMEVSEEIKNAETDENGFTIDENGVLTGYVGEGGDIVIPKGVTSIGSAAFVGNENIISVEIPEGVTNIGENAFFACSSLISIMIPESVTNIGRAAFCNCSNLTSITIPKNVADLGDEVFLFCGNLKNIQVDADNIYYTSENGILYNKDKSVLICCPTGKTGEVVIPIGVISIGKNAFRESHLTSITIAEGVTDIGEGAFRESGLTNIILPEGVTSIGSEAFSESGLTNITIPESVTSIGVGAFQMNGLTSVTIPGNAINIGEYAFSCCKNLTTVTILSGVTALSNNMFSGCISLTSVTIPESVKKIGNEAFYACDKELIIKCAVGSCAETYARENNIRYQYLEKKVQTITASDMTKTFGDGAFSLNAQTDGDGGLSYVSDNTAVATVDSNGTVTLTGAGTAHITITASETDTYKSAEKTITLTVKEKEQEEKEPEKKKQTITAKDITKTYGDKAFSLGAKTNGGGKLTYKISNTKIAAIDKKGKVTIKGCGKTQIKITAAAKGEYKETTKNIALTVKPQKAAITSVKSTKSKALTVKWKVDKKAKGYIIQYSTDKKFKKSVKTVTISKNKTSSKTIAKLKGGKTYYVRVCAYTTADGETIKGSYSKAEKVKVKK